MNKIGKIAIIGCVAHSVSWCVSNQLESTTQQINFINNLQTTWNIETHNINQIVQNAWLMYKEIKPKKKKKYTYDKFSLDTTWVCKYEALKVSTIDRLDSEEIWTHIYNVIVKLNNILIFEWEISWKQWNKKTNECIDKMENRLTFN